MANANTTTAEKLVHAIGSTGTGISWSTAVRQQGFSEEDLTSSALTPVSPRYPFFFFNLFVFRFCFLSFWAFVSLWLRGFFSPASKTRHASPGTDTVWLVSFLVKAEDPKGHVLSVVMF